MLINKGFRDFSNINCCVILKEVLRETGGIPELFLVNNMCFGQTVVPNAFLDKYLSSASGEYIKVYLLLLRMTGEGSVSLDALADTLGITSKEVRGALNYWEEAGLLEQNYEGDTLTSLVLMEMKKETGDGKISVEPAAPKKRREPAPVAAAMQDEEFRQAVYVSEKYLGRTLTRTDTELLFELHDEMGFDFDLIEHLVEYCVSCGHKAAAYMRKVAVGWHEAGVKTIEDAKAESKAFAEGKKGKASGNRFHNFTERKSDLNELLKG